MSEYKLPLHPKGGTGEGLPPQRGGAVDTAGGAQPPNERLVAFLRGAMVRAAIEKLMYPGLFIEPEIIKEAEDDNGIFIESRG